MIIKSVLFIFFTLFIFQISLFARDSLPTLIEDGEPLDNRDDFYIPTHSSVNTIAISLDGKTILSGSHHHGTIKMYDIKSARILKVFKGQKWSVGSVVISPNGKTIVSGSLGGNIKILDIENGKELKSFEGHTSRINSVKISPNGKIIVSASSDNSIKIWDIESGKELQTLEGHIENVYSVAISPNGKTIVSASSDNSIKIWDIESGKELKTLMGHTKAVMSVAISPNGKTLVSGSTDSSIKIWDIKSGKELKTLIGHTNTVISVAISSDGKTIVSGSSDNSIKIWDIESGKEIKSLEGHTDIINSVLISPDGKTIVSASRDRSIKIWDIESGKELKKLTGHIGNTDVVTINNKGKTFITGSSNNSIKIWDRESAKELKSFEGHTRSITAAVISSDGKVLVSASEDDSIKIWDIESGKELKSLKGHKYSINSVAISPDGKIIVSYTNNDVKIWDTQSGKELKSLEGRKYDINPLVVSPDGKTIILGLWDKSIEIRDIASDKKLKSWIGHTDTVTSVNISPDGKTLVSGSKDKSIKLWNIESGEELKSLIGHDSSVDSVAFSSNGKFLVSSSNNKSIKIWDIESGRELKSLDEKKYDVDLVNISLDSKVLTLGSKDGSITLWSMDKWKKIKEYVYGENGTWAVFDYQQKKVFRGDDGTFLYKQNGIKLELILPKLPLREKLELNANTHIEMLNESVYIYDVKMKNNSDETLYWIKSSYHDKYCTVMEQRISMLKANEEKILSLNLECQLPRNNPKSVKNHKINLVFETGSKNKFLLPLSVSIRYAEINVTKAEVSEDGKNLNVQVQNIGNETLVKSDINLSKPFQADIQSLTNLEANATRTLSFVIGENNITKTLALNIYIPNEESKNAVPLYEWHVGEGVSIALNKMAWYLYALMALGIAILSWLIWYFKRYKNTLVLKLQNNPKELLTLSPKLLTEAQTKLSTIKQWQTILESADVTQKSVDETLEFFDNSQEEKAKLFCQKIGATYSKEYPFYRIYLPKSFTLNMNTFLLYLTDVSVKEIEKVSIDQDDKVFILGKEEHQKELYKLASDKTNRLIAPKTEKLTEFLLSSQGEQVLIGIFSDCLLFKDISPYQVNSGVTNEANFFGQIEIIRDIVTKENINYLIVGARQLGKSSIIKALERRYVGSSKVECYSFTMDDENIVLAMSTALGLSSTTTLEEIVTAISNAPKKCLFLIDESDKFVKHEKESDYRITEAFRKLSQEGKATFVMTGFWTLYFYVTSDYHSPLKNFGELIKLEGLDHDACRDLMTKPMERIGVSYADDTVIENVIKLCGQRPNLIAITCNEVLKKLEGKVISQADIDEVVENSSLEDYLKGWGSMSESKMENRLDRVIVYLTLEKESFRLADVDSMLKEQGKQIDVNWIKSSLERLVVGYILEERKKNYSYRVPLFKQKLLEDDIEILLDGDMMEL